MLDPLLRAFFDARDEAGAEGALNLLVERHALPLARAIVARKLASYQGSRAGRSDAQDWDDVVADAMMTLVERLQSTKSAADAAPIENFLGYAAAVVHSTCAHYVRRRHPERARLKDRLRYLFSTEPRLALWTVHEDLLTCGLVGWRGRWADPVAERMLRQLMDAKATPWASMTRAGLSAAVIELAVSMGGPVAFDAFVAAAASAANILEPRETGDASVVPSPAPGQDVLIDLRRFLAQVWGEVGNLPVRQRSALLLNLRDSTGAGLLWLLPIAGVASIRQIARLLEIPDAEFARLWHEIPLDDAAIAQRLGCSRQQVINLRMAARKRLTNRTGGGTVDFRPPEANLVRFPASLKGSV
jgi:DNA-directed RNA polymerase specialized sigma24 family protein